MPEPKLIVICNHKCLSLKLLNFENLQSSGLLPDLLKSNFSNLRNLEPEGRHNQQQVLSILN